MTDARLRHLPALDGLRAVAVLAVVVFHAGAGWLPGGFLGVDLFFVLSGFLITTLLLREHQATGGIDLRGFWGRRVRRLLPALLVVLAAVVLYARFAAPVAARPGIRWDVLASLGYVANWRFAFGTASYFQHAAGPSPVQHLWSLAVEEQWYLLFPPVLLVVLRRRPGWLGRALVAATAASFAWMAVLSLGAADPTRVYEGTDTRAGTILVGALLAVLLHRGHLRRLTGRVAGVAAAAGLAVVAGFLAVAHGQAGWMYRGGFLVFALASAVVIAAVATDDAHLPGRLLSNRALGHLGVISYAVYLWHWPVGQYLTAARTGLGPVALTTARLVVPVVLAELSWRLVEHPVRHQRVRALARPATAFAACGVVVAAALLATRADVGPGGLAARTRPRPVHTVEHASQATPIDVAVVGDSVGFTLDYYQPRFRGMRLHGGGSVLGCGIMAPASLDPDQPARQECLDWPQRWARAADHRDEVLVVLGAWEVIDHHLDGRTLVPGTPDATAYLEQQLQRGIDIVTAAGTPRVAFLQLPCPGPVDDTADPLVRARQDPARVAWFNRTLDRVVARNRGTATIVSLDRELCPPSGPVAEVAGVHLRDDGVHWDERSAPLAWRWLEPQVARVAATPPHRLPTD